jgi:hypothetical protein
MNQRKEQRFDVCTELRQVASDDNDLAPCDFFLFPKMEFKLKGCPEGDPG